MKQRVRQEIVVYGSIFSEEEDEPVLSNIICHLNWRAPYPNEFYGTVYCPSTQHFAAQIISHWCYIEGHTGRGEEIRIWPLRLRGGVPLAGAQCEEGGYEFDIRPRQLEIIRRPLVADARVRSVTARFSLLSRHFTEHSTSNEKPMRHVRINSIDRKWADKRTTLKKSAAGASSTTATTENCWTLGFDDESFYTDEFINGQKFESSFDATILMLTKDYEEAVTYEKLMEELRHHSSTTLKVLRFLSREPSLQVWKAITEIDSNKGRVHIQRLTANTAQPTGSTRSNMGHLPPGVTLQNVIASYKQHASLWNLDDALMAYFSALAIRSPRQQFLNLYICLDALSSGFANAEESEFWITSRSARDRLKKKLRMTIDEWLSNESLEQEYPKAKLNDAMRQPAAKLQQNMFRSVGVRIDDLVDESNYPWNQLRHKLVHEGKSPAAGRLYAETVRLQRLVERTLLRILEIPESRGGLKPDSAFRSPGTSHHESFWV